MDNITHGLIGLLIADVVGPGKGSRRAAITAAVLASNAPDIDIVMRPFWDDPRLGYIIHHRGYTHTLLAALPLAAISVALAVWFAKPALPDWRRLFWISMLSVGLHLFADSWNNYGIHPFSPFFNRWFYNDFIFILEPLLWFSMIPYALGQTKSGVGNAVWFILIATCSALLWFITPPQPLFVFLALGFAINALLVHRRYSTVMTPLALTFLILTTFMFASHSARSLTIETLSKHAGQELILDISLSPRPSNPLCWQMIAASLVPESAQENGNSVISAGSPDIPAIYVARNANISLWPSIYSPEQCAFSARGGIERTATSLMPSLPSTEEVGWTREFRAEANGLRELAQQSCRIDGLCRFLRIPFWEREGSRMVAGDLRYDYERELGFAEIDARMDGTGKSDGCGIFPEWMPTVSRELLGRGRTND